MAEEKAAEPTESQAVDPAAKKKKLIIIIGGAVGGLLVIGAALFFFMSGGKNGETSQKEASGQSTSENPAPDAAPADHAAPEKAKDAHGAPATAEEAKGEKAAEGNGKPEDKGKKEASANPASDFGRTYKFKTFNLNLANPLSNHFVRLDLSIEYLGGDEQKAEIEARLPQLEDAIVTVTSQKTREFLLGPDGKDQLRREILIRLNRYMTKPLESVYITAILIE